MINAKTQNWFDERVPDMVNEKTLKRQLKKAEREENERNRKIQQKMKLWAESGNYIYKCISEFLLAKDRFARDPKKYYFLDSHHMVPRAVGDAVKKKIKICNRFLLVKKMTRKFFQVSSATSNSTSDGLGCSQNLMESNSLVVNTNKVLLKEIYEQRDC